jgi:hypothetical protein
MAPVTLKLVLTKTWCGQLILIMDCVRAVAQLQHTVGRAAR